MTTRSQKQPKTVIMSDCCKGFSPLSCTRSESSMNVCLPGPESLHVHTSDLHAASFAHGTPARPLHASLPADGQQHPRLRASAWPAVHRRHRGHPGLHGRAHRRHQTSRRAHGPQPTGQTGRAHEYSKHKLLSRISSWEVVTTDVFLPRC